MDSPTRQSIDPHKPSPHDNPQPRVIPYDAKRERNKLFLRTASFLFALALLGMSLTVFQYDTYNAIYMFCFGLSASCSCLLWDVAEGITILVKRRRSKKGGIHPGAHVVVEGFLWLMLLALCGAQFGMDGKYGLDYEAHLNDVRGHAAMVIIGPIIMGILGVIHFVLFMRAYVEFKAWRKAENGKRAVDMKPLCEEGTQV